MDTVGVGLRDIVLLKIHLYAEVLLILLSDCHLDVCMGFMYLMLTK